MATKKKQKPAIPSIKMLLPVTIPLDELIEGMNLDDVETRDMIMELDKSIQDWGFTEEAAKMFIEEMNNLYCVESNPSDGWFDIEGAKDWAETLRKAADKIDAVVVVAAKKMLEAEMKNTVFKYSIVDCQGFSYMSVRHAIKNNGSTVVTVLGNDTSISMCIGLIEDDLQRSMTEDDCADEDTKKFFNSH